MYLDFTLKSCIVKDAVCFNSNYGSAVVWDKEQYIKNSHDLCLRFLYLQVVFKQQWYSVFKL